MSAKPKRSRRFWITLAATALAAVCICNPCTLAIGVRTGVAEAFEIDGPAMEPNYQDGDRVWVAKTAYGLFLPFGDHATWSWSEPEIGDVVIARSPFDNIDIIKRVVGLAGDTIAFQEDVLVRNGHAVPRRVLGPAAGSDDSDLLCSEETIGAAHWTLVQSQYSLPDSMPPITVPAGHVFLLGDHRDRSNDSRNPRVGPVAVERIKGRVGSHYAFGANRIRCPDP